MKNVRLVRILPVLLVPLLGACAGGAIRPGPVTQTMDDAEFMKASSEVQTQYLQAIHEESVLLDAKKDKEYNTGRPVTYGDSRTGYTLQWDKKLGIVYIYPGHNPGEMSIESESALAFRADGQGNILYQGEEGKKRPTTLLANVATQKGVGRVMLEGVFQVLSSTLNGAVAADISKCDGDCGNTTLINDGGNSSAESGSYAESSASTSANATVGSRPGGSHPVVPLD